MAKPSSITKLTKPISGGFGDADDDWANADTLTSSMGERILFTPGVILIGSYVGTETIEVDSDRNDGTKENVHYVILESKEGKRYNFSPSYQLREAMQTVQEGDVIRIECTGEQSTKRGLNPVKLFTVKRKRNK